MIIEKKTLALIDEIEDETAGRVAPRVANRLTDLRHLIVAGTTLTTVERNEVSELWDKYVK